MLDILQELFHSNIAYHVVNYLGRQHLADIIQPQINNKGNLNIIRYDICKYHASRHNEDELSTQYWNRVVIENIINTKFQIRYLTCDDFHGLDPFFVHMNKEVIEEIIYSDEFRIIEDQYD